MEGDIDHRLEQARAHARAGRAREAEAAYRAVIASEPGNADAHYGLGRNLDHRGDEYGAARAYRPALEHDPEHDHAYERLGRLHIAGERPDLGSATDQVTTTGASTLRVHKDSCEDTILLNRPQVWVNLRSSSPPVPDSLDLRHQARAVEIPTLPATSCTPAGGSHPETTSPADETDAGILVEIGSAAKRSYSEFVCRKSYSVQKPACVGWPEWTPGASPHPETAILAVPDTKSLHRSSCRFRTGTS